jgi:hypothetical protein
VEVPHAPSFSTVLLSVESRYLLAKDLRTRVVETVRLIDESYSRRRPTPLFIFMNYVNHQMCALTCIFITHEGNRCLCEYQCHY